MTLAARLKHLLDWLIAHALLTPTRPGQQAAAIRYWPADADERRAQSDLYGRCFTSTRTKRPRAASTAGATTGREAPDGTRE